MKFLLSDYINIFNNLNLLSHFQFNDEGRFLRAKIKTIPVEDQYSISDKLKSCIVIPINPIKEDNKDSWSCLVDDVEISLWKNKSRKIGKK